MSQYHSTTWDRLNGQLERIKRRIDNIRTQRGGWPDADLDKWDELIRQRDRVQRQLNNIAGWM